MGYKDEGADWQACGVAQVGFVAGVGVIGVSLLGVWIGWHQQDYY